MSPARNNHKPPPLEKMIQDYLLWLYSIIFDGPMETEYWLLVNYLFKKEFYWSVPNDDNRAEDGKKFRGDYVLWKYETYYIWWDAPCTVFEMLAGVSCRMEDVLENPVRPSRVGDWFVLLITNLGLEEYTDDNFSSEYEQDIDAKIGRFLERKYDRYGVGGLFPLEQNVTKDQRKVEIWYQMMKYIDEEFDI